MKNEELLTKEFSFEATIDISIYDVFEQFDKKEQRALVKEMVDEVTVEDDDDLIEHELSLGDKYKLDYFKSVMDRYNLQQLETALP